MEKITITQKLLNIQNELKAPKSQYNTFGKYKYRNAEDILEAAKPICLLHKAVLTVSDAVVLVGDRFYIKATAILEDIENGEIRSTEAFAREEDSKKGMDSSQVTGAASSYARKYALNGLFCIDDTKDADNDDNSNKGDKKNTTHASAKQIELLLGLLNNSEAGIKYTKEQYQVESLDKLTVEQASEVIAKIRAKQGK